MPQRPDSPPCPRSPLARRVHRAGVALLGAVVLALAASPVQAQTRTPTPRAAAAAASAAAGSTINDRELGPGDSVRITVYQNPDLTTETRISDTGQVNMPLIGGIAIGSMTVPAAQAAIERRLREGGFVLRPQVTIQTLEIRSSQISVLGQVVRPGRYPIESTTSRVSEMIATAGGVTPAGADVVTLVGQRRGQPIKLEIDLPTILQSGRVDQDIVVENGDTLFVDRAPTFYIYGEVQKPGQYRLEKGMTVMQAMATGGGLTARGTERGMRVNRKNATGQTQVIDVRPTDPVQRDDVIYVRESIF